ncbi:MAG: PAS domain S-box protein [Clostridiales bacterium]|jgi:PAS domain S-box-containing protein|nr:PAS domain S-box protein [Clostridiales bacterium]
MSRDNNKSAEELRREAEKRLKISKQKGTSLATPAELQRLVHELEVHQIELEMQNEELQQVRSELVSYLKQYTDLYDFAPVGYITLNRSGFIQHINLTGSRMLGVERTRLVNQPFGRFVIADSRPAYTAFLAEVFISQPQVTFDIGLKKEGHGTFFVRVDASVSGDGQECRVALMDISAKKQAEELLRESERKYRTLFEAMSQGVVHHGSDGKIISANPAAEAILGISIDQMQAKTPTDSRWLAIREDGSEFPEDAHPSMVALRTGKALQNVVMGVFSPKADGYIWLNINAVPLFLHGEGRSSQVMITIEDITYRKRIAIYNKLTPREKEVFKLVAKGRNRRIIAEALNIRPKTVDKHISNLTEKLNLRKKDEIVQFATLLGLVVS